MSRDFLASYEKVREIQRETGKESKRSLEAVNIRFLYAAARRIQKFNARRKKDIKTKVQAVR
jgi:hypothetical protein